MKRIDRYLFKEILSPFLGGLFVLTIILLLNRVFELLDLIIKKGLHVLTVLEIFLLSLPFILALTVPMAVLIGALVAYGRLAQDFEILALKSLGVSVRRTLYAPLLFATLVFGIMVLFNNYVLPESNHKLKNLMIDVRQKKPAIEIKKGIFNKIDNYLLYIRDKNERTGDIFDITLEEVARKGVKTVIAEKGKIYSIGDEYLILELYDGEIHEATGEKKEEFRRIKFKKQIIKIPVDTKLVRQERTYRGDREMNIRMLHEKIESFKNDLRTTSPTDSIRIRILKRRINQLWVEIHKKFSIPFASIVFVLIGAPLAIIVKKGGYGSAFGISFILFTIYYVLLVGGEELAGRGVINAIPAMWFPNLFFLIIGILLIKKVE